MCRFVGLIAPKKTKKKSFHNHFIFKRDFLTPSKPIGELGRKDKNTILQQIFAMFSIVYIQRLRGHFISGICMQTKQWVSCVVFQ